MEVRDETERGTYVVVGGEMGGSGREMLEVRH